MLLYVLFYVLDIVPTIVPLPLYQIFQTIVSSESPSFRKTTVGLLTHLQRLWRHPPVPWRLAGLFVFTLTVIARMVLSHHLLSDKRPFHKKVLAVTASAAVHLVVFASPFAFDICQTVPLHSALKPPKPFHFLLTAFSLYHENQKFLFAVASNALGAHGP